MPQQAGTCGNHAYTTGVSIMANFNRMFWAFLGHLFSTVNNIAIAGDNITALAADASIDYRSETTELRSAARTKRRAELGLPPLEPAQ